MSRSTEKILDHLQKEAFGYFLQEYNADNGLVRNKSDGQSPASIAAIGFALASYIVASERGFMKRNDATKRTLAVVRFFSKSLQSTPPEATGYQGFYYHFLDMESGRRTGACELSTIDTGLLLLGMLAVAEYFSGDNAPEREIRERVDKLYQQADWNWACNGALTLSHGYKPRGGFLKYRWQGYNEGLVLYLLGLGSPSHPLTPKSYHAWTHTYQWQKIYDHEFLYAGPLFIHQFLHVWCDFRGLQDDFMRKKSLDYFENSRRATYIQHEYCRRNPLGFKGYSDVNWGITASDGPGPATRKIKGRRQSFYGYRARGVPFGPDDGTLSPWAAVTSLPFAPEIVLPTIEQFYKTKLDRRTPYGFVASFNPSFRNSSPEHFWRSKFNYGLNQGPLVLMIENFRSGLIWRLMRNCRPLVKGLQRAGFSGAWLPSNKTIYEKKS
jgi:hypothetical protein